jgi:hypothetical protein
MEWQEHRERQPRAAVAGANELCHWGRARRGIEGVPKTEERFREVVHLEVGTTWSQRRRLTGDVRPSQTLHHGDIQPLPLAQAQIRALPTTGLERTRAWADLEEFNDITQDRGSGCNVWIIK